LFLNWEHLCFVLCYGHNGDESPSDSLVSLVNLIPFFQDCFHLGILFVFHLLFHSTDEHTYVLCLGVLYLAYSYVHTYAVTLLLLLLLLLLL